ncbi:hypothetical protein RSOLAG22IIIB_01641 [Rhizoctonia solani]|uniref:Uncharacterized protein n=1 Tax=Rhizoctonia solani TaxID=456999 RepID=A0A0K6G968_9AGAM|nr:unnamed protein product [Rhizoctonia solani]CUA75006.1 hypothetical protein RSOLAG22IIIB_01641 [Rhizoctonia solani]
MSHTIHIHRSVISSPSKMSSTRPITNQWASVVSRRKLQLACDGQGKKDVNILHRLVLVSNFARAHQGEDELTPPPAPTTAQPESFVFPDLSQSTQPPSNLEEADWLDAILQELEEEAEVMVSCLPADDGCGASSSNAPVEDDDVIVCDSYFSICSCPSPSDPAEPDPRSAPASFQPESPSHEELADSLSDLPFHSIPSLVSSHMDVDSDEEGPTTPSTSFVDTEAATHSGCHDPYDEPLSPLFDEPVTRSPIIRTCVPYNPLFISSTYC